MFDMNEKHCVDSLVFFSLLMKNYFPNTYLRSYNLLKLKYII